MSSRSIWFGERPSSTHRQSLREVQDRSSYWTTVFCENKSDLATQFTAKHAWKWSTTLKSAVMSCCLLKRSVAYFCSVRRSIWRDGQNSFQRYFVLMIIRQVVRIHSYATLNFECFLSVDFVTVLWKGLAKASRQSAASLFFTFLISSRVDSTFLLESGFAVI